MVLFYYISLVTRYMLINYTLYFFTPCRSNIGVNHLINFLLSRTEAFLEAIPDTHASLAVILSSRLPDVDVDPLTLIHDPARLVLATILRAISRDKNDG